MANVCEHCSGTGFVDDPRELGMQMRKRREEREHTLREIAGKMNISPTYLSDLELGRRHWKKKIKDKYLAAIA